MIELLPIPKIDHEVLHQYRLQRIRQQLIENNTPMCVILSPINLRYAIDFREYQQYQSHIPMFYLFVSVTGTTTLFSASHQNCSLVDEYKTGVGFNTFDSGFDLSKSATDFVVQIRNYLSEIGITDKNPVIASERLPAPVYAALRESGVRIDDGESLLERARMIKSEEEIQCIKHSIAVANLGIQKMRATMEPGVTENQLWSVLHQINIANDGDWMEGRMLASGPRTNPWLQEATSRPIQNGELVAFDTDMIGPFGYCADISRTWLCGDRPVTAAQQDLIDHAHAEVEHNMALLRPGITFQSLQENTFDRDNQFIKHRYPCFMHGVGMSDEYPKLLYPEDKVRSYDGVIEENMVICIESFTGSDQGGEGVKFEQMVKITKDGCELLSTYSTGL